jgi:hypothetical protein
MGDMEGSMGSVLRWTVLVIVRFLAVIALAVMFGMCAGCLG